MRFIVKVLAALSLTLTTTSAFVMPPASSACIIRSPTMLPMAWEDSPEYEDAVARNKARTCVRNFMTQRAIQSLMFLCETCRDPHTVKWFEENYGFTNMNSFHGTGAFNLTEYEKWDAVLLDILSRPKEVIVVSAKRRGRGHGGWSKDNPYLPDRWVEFNIDIDPPSLVFRILSVREQIAKEWITDLETINKVTDNILTSYFSNQADAREREGKRKKGEHSNEPKNFLGDPDVAGMDTDAAAPSPYSSEPLPGERRIVFDREALYMLSNTVSSASNQGSSPYRAGNFDLLVLLSTQESVHRVLRDYQADSDRQVSFDWFRDFYTRNAADYFDGDQKYGRADDFLEELLLTSPFFKELQGKSKKNEVCLVDPLRIAEDVIRMRNVVCEDWKEIVANTPRDHTELRKALLARQMGQVVEIPPPQSAEGGEFE